MLNTGLLVLRLAVGLIVAAHGAQKLFGWFGGPGIDGFAGVLSRLGIRPERPMAVLAGLAEFGGGLLVAIGFLNPISPLFMAGAMIVAIFAVHVPKGFWNTKGGYEFPLTILSAGVAISLTGPGRFSLDSLLGVHFPEPMTWLLAAVLVAAGSAGAMLSTRFERGRSRRPAIG